MDEIGAIRELVTQLRALKAERNLSNNKQVEFFHLSDEQGTKTIEENEAAILSMVGIAKLKNVDSAPAGLPATVTPLGTFFLDLSAGVDLESECKRLTKEAQSLEGIIRGIEAKLNNASFVDKAPPQVVEGARTQLSDNQAKLKETQDALAALSQ